MLCYCRCLGYVTHATRCAHAKGKTSTGVAAAVVEQFAPIASTTRSKRQAAETLEDDVEGRQQRRRLESPEVHEVHNVVDFEPQNIDSFIRSNCAAEQNRQAIEARWGN